MKILSTVLGILAIINFVCINLTIFTEIISDWYLGVSLIYCVFHIIYQIMMKEGIYEWFN